MHYKFTRNYDLIDQTGSKKINDYCYVRQYSVTEIKKFFIDLKKSLFKDLDNYYDYIEHTSANPVSQQLHLGNVINGIIGDLFSRLSNTSSSYWVNDLGNQFSKVVLSDLKYGFNNYSIADFPEQSLLQLRKKFYSSGLTEDAIKSRDYYLNAQLTSLKKIGLNYKNIIFESDYIEQIRNLELNCNASSPSECLSYKGVPVFTSKTKLSVPLYAASDIVYRTHLCEKYTRPLIILGPEQKSTSERVNSIVSNRLNCFYTPSLKKNALKLSKRNNNVETLEQLIAYLKKRCTQCNKKYHAASNDVILKIIKFVIFKNSNKPVLDFHNVSCNEYEQAFRIITSSCGSSIGVDYSGLNCIKEHEKEVYNKICNAPYVLKKALYDKELYHVCKYLETIYNMHKTSTAPIKAHTGVVIKLIIDRLFG